MTFSSEESYPMRGYIYRDDGYHEGPTYLEDEKELYGFLTGPALRAHLQRREVMVTDCWDYTLFHSKNGVVLWPIEEERG